jgi:dihydroorotase
MVDIYDPPPSVEHILGKLRPGDILTHCCVPAGNSLANSLARLELARQTRGRGIVLDIGHGMGSFSFRVAERMGEAGLWPDTISTDLHTGCIHGPVFDLPTTMSKLLCAGMPLADVLASVTSRPRAALGEPACATLAPGQAADIAVLRLSEDCEFIDVQGERRVGPLFECLLTVRDGRIIYQNPRMRYTIKHHYAGKSARKGIA